MPIRMLTLPRQSSARAAFPAERKTSFRQIYFVGKATLFGSLVLPAGGDGFMVRSGKIGLVNHRSENF